MASIIISYQNIPNYLRAGEFFRNLSADDPEGIIEIPADCYQSDENAARSLDEFSQLLRVTIFWVLDSIPLGILNFCNHHDVVEWKDIILNHPGALEMNILPALVIAYSEPVTVPFDKIMETERWDLIIHALGRMTNPKVATGFAAKAGYLPLLKYLHEQGYAWYENTCAYASFHGHLACLQYAHEHGCPWDFNVLEWAAQGGQLECMKYAHEQGLEWQPRVCALSAAKGHFNCLQYAYEHGCVWDCTTITGAVQSGSLESLQYALEHGCPHDEKSCRVACHNGHLPSLQLLHQYGAFWDETTSFFAVQTQEIACLQYLHEHGCPWDADTPQQCASSGYIQPLQYALGNGCNYDNDLTQNAARGSNLECLQYLIEEQLLYMNEIVFIFTLLRGDLSCLQYLFDQGCPYQFASVYYSDDASLELYDKVFRKENPEFIHCLQLAIERGWVPAASFYEYIIPRDPVCTEWLVQEGHVSYAERLHQPSLK